MIRSEVIAKFREENPEFPSRVIADTILYTWLIAGDKEFCAITRCIVSDTAFNSVVSASVYLTRYDLTALITKFYDIDEFPGGGVSYNDKPLDKATLAELDEQTPTWRTGTAGTPTKWYRRGKYLYFNKPVSAVKEIRVYCALISDDWNADVAPYNQEQGLEPFHYGMVKYITWKAKEKIGKPEDATKAAKEFYDYCTWAKKLLGGNKYGPIRMTPKAGIYQPLT